MGASSCEVNALKDVRFNQPIKVRGEPLHHGRKSGQYANFDIPVLRSLGESKTIDYENSRLAYIKSHS